MAFRPPLCEITVANCAYCCCSWWIIMLLVCHLRFYCSAYAFYSFGYALDVARQSRCLWSESKFKLLWDANCVLIQLLARQFVCSKRAAHSTWHSCRRMGGAGVSRPQQQWSTTRVIIGVHCVWWCLWACGIYIYIYLGICAHNYILVFN